MTEKKEETNFRNSKSDVAAGVARAGLAAIPYLGAALSEIVGAIIPNQRIDRVTLYLEKLQSLFSEKEWQAIKKLPEKVAMIEEGIYAAGLTPYKERVDRIAYVIANGLSQEQIRADKLSKLLFAAKNISDFDVIILESYRLWDNNAEGYELALAFRKEHPEIWPSIDHSFFDDDYDKEAYKKSKEIYDKAQEDVASSERHLTSLALLRPYKSTSIFIDKKQSVDGLIKEIEKLNASIAKEEYRITGLGIAVLDMMKKPTGINVL